MGPSLPGAPNALEQCRAFARCGSENLPQAGPSARRPSPFNRSWDVRALPHHVTGEAFVQVEKASQPITGIAGKLRRSDYSCERAFPEIRILDRNFGQSIRPWANIRWLSPRLSPSAPRSAFSPRTSSCRPARLSFQVDPSVSGLSRIPPFPRRSHDRNSSTPRQSRPPPARKLDACLARPSPMAQGLLSGY